MIRKTDKKIINGRYSILANKLIRRMLKYYFAVFLCLMLILCLLLFPALYSIAKHQTEAATVQLRDIFSSRQKSAIEYTDVLAAQTIFGNLLDQWEQVPSDKNRALIELYLQDYVSDHDDVLMVIVDDHANGVFQSLAHRFTEMSDRLLNDAAYKNLSGSSTGTLYFPISLDPLDGIDSTVQNRSSIAVAKNYEINSRTYTISLYCKADTTLSSADLIAENFFDYWWVQWEDEMYYTSGDIPSDRLVKNIYADSDSADWLFQKWGYVSYNTVIDSKCVTAGFVSWNKLMSDYFFIIMIVMFLYILSPVLYSFFLVGTINRSLAPLKQLSDTILTYSSGGTAKVDIHSGDELEQLGERFNEMMNKINEHFEEVKEYERENAVSQFRLLSIQIDPHFIYNTMNIITLLARRKDTRAVVEVNSTLMHILRQRLNNNLDVFDTIEGELKTLQQYQIIMDYRYASSVNIKYDIDPKIQSEPILKNILQPLVENAYFHGLSLEDGNIKGNIILSIHLSENADRIEILVYDDGRGIPPERLALITAGVPPKEGGTRVHIGLSNIRQRLSIIYQNRETMEITSAPGKGTRIRITYPIQTNPSI